MRDLAACQVHSLCPWTTASRQCELNLTKQLDDLVAESSGISSHPTTPPQAWITLFPLFKPSGWRHRKRMFQDRLVHLEMHAL